MYAVLHKEYRRHQRGRLDRDRPEVRRAGLQSNWRILKSNRFFKFNWYGWRGEIFIGNYHVAFQSPIYWYSQPLLYEWEGGYQYRICFTPILRIWREGTDTEPKRRIFPDIEEIEDCESLDDEDDEDNRYPDDDDFYVCIDGCDTYEYRGWD